MPIVLEPKSSQRSIGFQSVQVYCAPSRPGEADLDKIRVLLANHPVMVPDAIRQLVAGQDDMELVADCRGPMKILQETGRTKADAVILTQEGTDEPGICSQLLAVYPDLTILSVTADMTTAFTQKLCSNRHELMGVEVESIVQALRSEMKAAG